MENKALFKISLIISFLGIIILLFISGREPAPTAILNISNLTLGAEVKIQGNMTGIRELSKDFYSLTIKDSTASIEVILDKNFSSSKTLEILGKLESYNNRTQVRAEKIKEI